MDLISSRTLVAASLSTLAALASLPGPPQRVVTHCQEVDAHYLFVPGDVTAVDGWTSIAPTGGTAGRWLLGADAISIASIGGGADDAARVQSALTAISYKARLNLRAGAYTWATTANVPSGSHIVHEPGVVITSTQATGADTSFIYNAVPTYAGAAVLAASVTVGANTVSSNTSFPAGTRPWIGQTPGIHQFVAQQYTVISVAGIGPFTLTLDRPVLFPFLINDLVRPISVPVDDIVIEGNGARLTGTVDRFVRIQGGYRCLVTDFEMRPTGANTPHGMSWDLACLDCKSSGIAAYDCAAATQMESSERLVCEAHWSERSGTGVLAYDCANCDIIACSTSGNSVSTGQSGVTLRTNPGNTQPVGCFDVRVYGGEIDFTQTGVSLSRSTDCTFVGLTVTNCETNYSTSANATRTTFSACTSKRATVVGFDIQGPGCRLIAPKSLSDLRFMRVAGASVNMVEITSSDVSSYGDSGFVRIDADVVAGAFVRVLGGRAQSTSNNANGVDIASPCTVMLRDLDLSIGATFGILHRNGAAGVCILEGVTITGAGGAIGYSSGNGGNTLRKYGRNDLNVTTPYQINAASFVNSPTGNGAPEGTFVLTGAVAVAYAFPDVKASDSVKLTRRVAGGVAGVEPTFVITPGTGVAITGTAQDTSTYDIEIG